MLARLDHVALTVTNLERSIRFYQDCFGFQVVRQEHYGGPMVEEVTSYKNAEFSLAFLTTGGVALQLMEWRSPKGGSPQAPRMYDTGSPHLGLLTKDVQADYKRLREMGVSFFGPPVFAPSRGTYTVYLKDPDGIPLELIERPSLEV